MATILLAEDNPGFRSLVEFILGSDHHQVCAVADGREALEYLKAHTPDLIILDVAMPVMDGISVCDRIKRISRLKRVPVMMLTALRDRATETKARAAGAERLLYKPLIGKDFRQLVAELCETAGTR